jgi:tRNA-specific 2-thiouridylase
MEKKRVLLGMSGGVDSSVCGHLLKEQGYEVVGVTMKVWPQDCMSRAEDKCCGPSAIADARGVAHALGIPHYVVDESNQFEQLVIDYFSSEYQAGRTPNPCVMCNEKLKFGNLWTKAKALGCDYIATGHYTIIEHHADRAVLRKGADPKKDQSYFLFSLNQEQLSHALTPLGGMSKTERRSASCRGMITKRFCAAIWARRSFTAEAFTTKTGTSSPNTRGSRCLPSASVKGCPADRRVRCMSSTSIRRPTA